MTETVGKHIGEKSLMNDYFDTYEKYAVQYGRDYTIVLIQNGTFHEAYQTLTDGADLQKVSDLTDYHVTKKNKSIPTVDRKNPYMLGVPSGNVHKLLRILVDAGYTVIIIDQVTPPPKPKREVTGVYSASTYIQDVYSLDKCPVPTRSEANFLMCVYLEEGSIMTQATIKQYIVGICLVDISTGRVIVHECLSKPNNDLYYPLDEVNKFHHSYKPSEVIIVYRDISLSDISTLINYTEISHPHLYDIATIKTHVGCQNVDKIKFQTEIINNVYFPESHDQYAITKLELDELNFGRLALCITLNYINNHNTAIIPKIQAPEIYKYDTNVYYGNNVIHQLNIFSVQDTHKKIYTSSTKFRSLFDVINETKTPMGKRLLHDQLVEPSTDIAVLNKRYDDIQTIIHGNHVEKMTDLLNFNDIERLNRKIILGIAHPTEIYTWYQNLQDSIILLNYLTNSVSRNYCQLIRRLERLIKNLNENLDISQFQKYLINGIDGKIFQSGIHQDLDEVLDKMQGCNNNIDDLCQILNNILSKYIKKTDKDLIQVKSTEREGHFLILTKKRAEILEQYLQENPRISVCGNVIDSSSLIFKPMISGVRTKIFAPSLKASSIAIQEYISQVRELNKQYLIEYMKNLCVKYKNTLPQLVREIAYWDFINSGANVAVKYHYSCPIITDNNTAYFSATNLRHPIVERISQTAYVPLTISLGKNMNGMLLYGLNSAGKSTLMKSIGLAIIMAQIGYWVPAEHFEYRPYTSIIARISDGDNIFRGFSSFEVEMVELKAILKRCDQNTLVIADEVCKGTEHLSSIIIIQAMLELLSHKNASFITASHLHEIANNQRIKYLKNIGIYHLHIGWDEKEKNLIYDRELREGSGDSFYGLLVAKYLINDREFSELTDEIKGNENIVKLVGDKQSRYNSDIIMTKCQICGYQPLSKSDKPLETHHVEFQMNCSTDGFIHKSPHIHKNHASNLAVLCSDCHDKIDNGKIYDVKIIGGKLEWKNM